MNDREFDRDEYISECYATPAHNVRRPHKHAELIKAWADGAEIQYKVGKTWFDVEGDPRWADITEYRIKPEPKPDYFRYIIGEKYSNKWFECPVLQEEWESNKPVKPQIKITFDGETGELKSAEVLK